MALAMLQHVEMAMDSGRLRLTLLEEMERAISIHFSTRRERSLLTNPVNILWVSTIRQLKLRCLEGTAVVNAIEQTLTLASNQRAEIPTGQSPNGPLAPERNLIKTVTLAKDSKIGQNIPGVLNSQISLAGETESR